ncbi:hypothetical protein SH668x_000194 [Planctomicrobium sp. SH668]|uniref:hypothetical protein n=1 Tax=Planctomicrobium sp. SH668 TaxID=3448126 RepID=UPI003F5C7065
MQISTHQQWKSREGISLFEVVLALAIFVGAVAAISQVLANGSRAASRAQLQSQAVLIGERVMNEVIAEIVPLSSAAKTPVDGMPKWFWTVDVSNSNVPGLLRVEVITEHEAPTPNSVIKYQLVRFVRDPQAMIDALNVRADLKAQLEADAEEDYE